MVLLYALGTVALVNCAYFILFAKFSFNRQTPSAPVSNRPVSLIVCAKNEEKNLQKHIPLWLQQEYPSFELILINDASSDDSLEIMEQFAQEDVRISVVNVRNNEAFWANKKYALTLGIKRARYNHLVFTDADCYPSSASWLSHMAAKFSDKKKIVLGFGAYEKLPGFLNKLIRYETVMTAVQYFSYAQAGMPYMGVGRNLAYTSELYYGHNGFIKHIKIASGDDDLFVNESASAENTAICTHPEAFTYSLPKKTWKRWITQKSRHYTTAKFYKPIHKMLLGSFFLSSLFFWLLSLAVLFTQSWMYGLGIIVFRLLLQYIVLGKGAKKLKENDIVPVIPILEFFLIFTQMSIFISGKGEKNTTWK